MKKTYKQLKEEVESIIRGIEEDEIPQNLYIIDESSEEIPLFEKLITFGGQAYPKFGNVVILAGGAGSGKGFVLGNLVGIEGKTFDVDFLKSIAAKAPGIQKRVKDELGVDLKNLAANLRDPDNVAKLHEIIGDYLKLPDKSQAAFYTSIIAAAPDRKPNIIFDVTLKDMRKLEKITRQVSGLGYDKSNVHIVWVVNDIEVAIKQNAERDRRVRAEILINTHRGASQTMGDILNMGEGLSRYMDGDIVFAFNKVGVDSNMAKNPKKVDKRVHMSDKLDGLYSGGGSYIVDANYFYIKRRGGKVTPISSLDKEIRHKIAQYVPKGVSWE